MGVVVCVFTGGHGGGGGAICAPTHTCLTETYCADMSGNMIPYGTSSPCFASSAEDSSTEAFDRGSTVDYVR